MLAWAWVVAPAEAQEVTDSTAVTSTLTGVFTADQAAKGGQAYRKNCTACHAPISYTGLAFRRVWTGRSIFDLFDLVRTTMPNDNPGMLSRGEYAAIMAYLLKLNGLPAGENELPNTDDALKTIRIELPPRNPP